MSFDILEVLYLARNSDPDLALLRIRKGNRAGQSLPNPIPLCPDISQKKGSDVVAVGYPARDPRNYIADVDRIFNLVFNVKRVQPGKVMEIQNETDFTHDCSTLGGNSGSPIIDISTGKAVGIHWGGAYLQENNGVSVGHILKILSSLQ